MLSLYTWMGLGTYMDLYRVHLGVTDTLYALNASLAQLITVPKFASSRLPHLSKSIYGQW